MGKILTKLLPDKTLTEDARKKWESENNELFPKENYLSILLEIIFH